MVGAPPWDPSSPAYSRHEQSMLDYKGWFVIPTTLARAQSFIKTAKLNAYDVADDMNDNNFATVLESIVIMSSLQA